MADFPEEIRNLAEATLRYNFSVVYVKGERNTLADYFSRFPVRGYGQPVADDVHGRPTPVEALVRSVHASTEERRAADPALMAIKEHASMDDEYQQVLDTLKAGVTSHEVKTKIGKNHPARLFQHLWSRLGVLPDEHGTLITLDQKRIVIPQGYQRKLINTAHMSHQGITRTLKSLSIRYYWNKMREQVQNLVQDCAHCARFNRAKPKDPPVEPEVDVENLDPMESIGVDVFHYQRKYYLVIACLATGFSFCELLGKHTTCKETTEKMKRMFDSFGYPSSIRFDGGPYFSKEFRQMLKDYNIPETPSSAYNQASNGLAERHVGVVKLLLKKCVDSKQDFRSALAALNSTSRHDGYSPADLFYKRRLRTALSDINREIDFVEGQKSRSRDHIVMRENMRGGKVQLPFKLGDVVLLKEEVGSKKGEFRGQYVVTHIRPRAKSYFVKDLETGRTYLRNQDRIKLHPDYQKPDLETKTVKLIKDCVQMPMKGILKKPGSKIKTYNNVCFDATFHTARIVAKQSIKEWLQKSTQEDK